MFNNAGAARSCAAGERARYVCRIDPRVVREIKRRDEIVDVRQRPVLADVGRGDFMRFHAEAHGHAQAAPHLLGLVTGHRQLDRAAVDEAGCQARLGLEASVEILGVLGEAGLHLGITQGGQQAGRMPGSAAGQLMTLQQQHILPAVLRQVVGNGAADDSAADDDHSGPGGQGTGFTGGCLRRRHGLSVCQS